MPHRSKISSLTAVTYCRLELQPVVTKIPKCLKGEILYSYGSIGNAARLYSMSLPLFLVLSEGDQWEITLIEQYLSPSSGGVTFKPITSEWPKLHRVLAVLSAIGLKGKNFKIRFLTFSFASIQAAEEIHSPEKHLLF